ncbi:hypothetical protein [Mycobacterium colombiense]|uniref:hypothetical protein n=1 Tax=Mycobacterium colombiense TaxID=339268 RepID=UPI001150124C|nr:hypothetical protein [Mycobacterium colombiense]
MGGVTLKEGFDALLAHAGRLRRARIHRQLASVPSIHRRHNNFRGVSVGRARTTIFSRTAGTGLK